MVQLSQDVFVCFCSRSVCLASVQTSMETGIITGRRTIWLELSDTQESMMEIMNITSHFCSQTSTRSECLKADDVVSCLYLENHQTDLNKLLILICASSHTPHTGGMFLSFPKTFSHPFLNHYQSCFFEANIWEIQSKRSNKSFVTENRKQVTLPLLLLLTWQTLVYGKLVLITS